MYRFTAKNKGLITAIEKDKLLANVTSCATGSQTFMNYRKGKVIIIFKL